MANQLLIVTAIAEAATGLLLLVLPAVVAPLLLGAPLDAPAALVVARIAGGALLSLGCACWLARNESPAGVGGMVRAMLLYNVVAAAVLAHAVVAMRLAGVLTWPALALHTALALWCLACLRGGAASAGGRVRSNSW